MARRVLLIARFLIAAIFITSGFEKVLSPSENFLYLLQAYDIFPHVLQALIAVIFPWVELGMGVFLALGLWLRPVLFVIACTESVFILVLGQAIFRGLPIDSCGCFGNLVHLPVRFMIFFDAVTFAAVVFSLKDIAALRRFSLDAEFEKTGP